MGITISDVDDPRASSGDSSVPAEGKSTIGMLLAASAAHFEAASGTDRLRPAAHEHVADVSTP